MPIYFPTSLPGRLGLAIALALLLLTLVSLCFPSATHRLSLDWWLSAAGYRKHTLSLPDGVLSYREGGSGEPLLLVHGFGGDGPVTWGPVMPGLAKQWHVLAPDLLWFGGSASTARPSLLAEADALEALIRQRGLTGVRLVGVSYGGFVALELARRLPDRISQLVIMSSPGMVYGQEDLRQLLARSGAPSADQLFVPGRSQDVARLMAVVGSPLARAPGFVLEDVRQHYYQGREDAMRALMRELVDGSQDYAQRFSTPLALPVTVIWGARDDVFPLDIGQRLARRLSAPLITIDGGTHLLPVLSAPQTLTVLQQVLRP